MKIIIDTEKSVFMINGNDISGAHELRIEFEEGQWDVNVSFCEKNSIKGKQEPQEEVAFDSHAVALAMRD